MSKIAEQKALETYPPCINPNGFDLAESRRVGYIAGYDKAMQDFLEKAERWLSENSDKYIWHDEFYHRKGMSDEFIDDFKNYMQNEM